MPETFRLRTDGATVALYAGALLVQSVAAVPGVVRLLYDGVKVRVLNDGVELIATAAEPGQRLFPKVVPFNTGVRIYDIAIGPAGLQPDVNSNIVDSGGLSGGPLPRTDLVTPLGVSAAIAGQGALATQNDVATIIGPTEILIPASNAGILEGTDPYATDTFKLFENGSQVTSGIVWGRSTPANITTTLTGSGTGAFSVNAMAVDEVDLTISAARAGMPTRYFPTKVRKSKAAPPTGGSGGSGTTASQTSAFATYSSATAAPVSNELQITVGTSGVAVLAASLENYPQGGINGTWYDRFQWYRWNGAAYVAIGTTFDATIAETVRQNGYTDGEGVYNPPHNEVYPGSVSNSQNYASGNGTVEKFKLHAWKLANGSTDTTRVTTLYGQISATG